MALELSTLTVVVPSWENPDLTIRCATALMEDGVPAQRIVLVDNGSTDDSSGRIAAAAPHCKVVRLETNIGYGRAANAGAASLSGAAYLILNNDAYVHTPGTIARLLEALDGDESVGIVVPRLVNDDHTLQRSVFPIHSPATALARASGASLLVPDRWQPSWGTRWSHGRSREIHSATGAVLLVRGTAWHELGGFDESIYMYAEELDLFWRAARRGWRAWFASDAEFVHLGSATARTRWSDVTRSEMVWRSEAPMIRRHLPNGQARLTLGAWQLGLVGRLLGYALLGQRDQAASVRGALRGLRAGSREPA